jgi:dihydroneopterin aldolase
LRVMVEGEDRQLVEKSAQHIADVVRKLASG